MIYIYSHTITNRLKYTLDVLFNVVLQTKYALVDKDTFNANSDYPKINYSEENLLNSIWIKPHSLLFEDDIKVQDIAVTHKKELPYFFKTSDEADFKFDIFASSFYMVSRYEEYLPFTPDEHGRFTAKESLAYKANFLHLPVVHLWAKQLRDKILKQNPNFLFPTRIFTQLNTIDIDIAYAYNGKPKLIFLGGIIRSLLRFNIKEVVHHFNYLNHGIDVYDTYDLLKKIQDNSNVENIYFFQVGKHGKYDKNLPLKQVMNKLILEIDKYAKIGIHPSYQSNNSIEILQSEKESLLSVLNKPITKSRQHYLKMTFPETYENLISIGIQEDHTMGFAQQVGFRAGMAIPFPFFNVKTDKQRPLTIVPFQVMDGTLKDYMQLSPKEAIVKVQEIKKIIRAVNGQFVSIFHNSSLTDQGEWKAWLDVFKKMFS